MKVFISHSSLDKWIARRIAQDLDGLGVTTFLDEKDIETGESIDDSLQSHLRESDELLVVLSPPALSSSWVLIEIGGAKALGMRLVPILLHVGPNELPSPVSKHLARDLNAIESYYDEVRKRIESEKSGKKAERPRPKTPARRPGKAAAVITSPPPSRFAKGQRVKIAAPARPAADRPDLGWNDTMDQYRGTVTEITEVSETHAFANLAIDQGKWAWALEWLVPYEASDD